MHHGDKPLAGPAFSADGSLLSAGETARLWEVATGRQVFVFPHESDVVSADVAGERILSYEPGVAHLWDVHTGAAIATIATAKANAYPVLSRRGTRLAVRYPTGVHLYDTATGVKLFDLETGAQPNDMQFATQDDRVAISFDATVRVYGTIRRLDHRAASGAVLYGPFGPGDDTPLATSGDVSPKVWDTRTGQLLAVIPSPGWARLDHTGKTIALFGSDNLYRVYDVASTRLLNAVELEVTGGRGQKARPGSIGMDISPDGKRLYTETATRLDVWRAEANALAATYGVRFSNSLALSPDHRTLAVGGPAGIIVEIDLATGARMSARRPGDALVYDVNDSPDGKRLAIASDGAGASIDLDTDRERVLMPGVVSRVVWSPDGAFVLTAGGGTKGAGTRTPARARASRSHPSRDVGGVLTACASRPPARSDCAHLGCGDRHRSRGSSRRNTQFAACSDDTPVASGGHSGEGRRVGRRSRCAPRAVRSHRLGARCPGARTARCCGRRAPSRPCRAWDVTRRPSSCPVRRTTAPRSTRRSGSTTRRRPPARMVSYAWSVHRDTARSPSSPARAGAVAARRRPARAGRSLTSQPPQRVRFAGVGAMKVARGVEHVGLHADVVRSQPVAGALPPVVDSRWICVMSDYPAVAAAVARDGRSSHRICVDRPSPRRPSRAARVLREPGRAGARWWIAVRVVVDEQLHRRDGRSRVAGRRLHARARSAAPCAFIARSDVAAGASAAASAGHGSSSSPARSTRSDRRSRRRRRRR